MHSLWDSYTENWHFRDGTYIKPVIVSFCKTPNTMSRGSSKFWCLLQYKVDLSKYTDSHYNYKPLVRLIFNITGIPDIKKSTSLYGKSLLDDLLQIHDPSLASCFQTPWILNLFVDTFTADDMTYIASENFAWRIDINYVISLLCHITRSSILSMCCMRHQIMPS